MIKKLLAIFLSALMLLGVCAVFATADEPVEKPDHYVMKDTDFTTLKTYPEGNSVATILYPGDTIYFQEGIKTSVTYYPDVDTNPTGEWVAKDAGMTAFSLSAKPSYTDEVQDTAFIANGNKYTVLSLSDHVNAGTPLDAAFDFTICYPESNTFVGWVVFSCQTGATGNINQLMLYGLWNKTVTGEVEVEEDDDITTIFDTNITWLQKLTAPFLAYNLKLVNSILDQLQDVLDKMTGTETEDNGDIGAYQASFQAFKIAMEIFARWLDSWVTPIVELFD